MTSGGVTIKFEYDRYGNITAKGVVDETGKIAEDTKIACVYENDRLTTYNGRFITYDAQGNPTTYLGYTLTWEKDRQLKSFDSNTYTYNTNGIRTSKTVNGITHTYTLDGANILRETWGPNALVPMYDNEENICGIIYNDNPFYFQKNLQGDIIAIVDKSGKVVAEYSYDAWGVCTIQSDTSGCNIATINPYRYRGYYYDAEIEMYYLQSRYYDPVLGRFVNADESYFVFFNTNNIFGYCCSDPINHEDAWGYCCTTAGSQTDIRDIANEFKISASLSRIKIRLPWLASLILGLIFLVFRGFLITKDIKNIHQLTNYLPATVAMVATHYVPLTLLAEIVSAVCNVTSVVMVASILLSITTAGITGGISLAIGEVLKTIWRKLGKALLNYAIPSMYDILQMLSQSALHRKGCFYVFKYVGGATIQF